jgi:hypothetical protein
MIIAFNCGAPIWIEIEPDIAPTGKIWPFDLDFDCATIIMRISRQLQRWLFPAQQ